MIIREILNVGRAMAQIEVQIMTFVIMRVFSSSLLHPPSSARVHKICNGKGAVTSVHAIKPFLIAVLDGGEWSNSRPGLFTTREGPPELVWTLQYILNNEGVTICNQVNWL